MELNITLVYFPVYDLDHEEERDENPPDQHGGARKTQGTCTIRDYILIIITILLTYLTSLLANASTKPKSHLVVLRYEGRSDREI